MAQAAYIIKKKKKSKSRLLIAIICIVAVLSAITAHFFVNVNLVLETITNDEVKSVSTVILNNALNSVMGKNITYEDIVSIKKDESGNIDAMSVNTILVNNIAQDTTLLVQSELNKIGKLEISVPIGSLSGITFLGGLGPDIKVICMPVGSVSVSFKSVFSSAGINSTLHSVIMNFDTTVNIILPGFKNSVNVKTEVLVADTIIFGKIPDIYLNSTLDGMLNLVPKNS